MKGRGSKREYFSLSFLLGRNLMGWVEWELAHIWGLRSFALGLQKCFVFWARFLPMLHIFIFISTNKHERVSLPKK
jgi:hypothetical protein